MKRKVSILLSGVLMLSLTACGGNQASAPETTEAAKAVAAAETTAEEKGTYTPGTYTAVGKGFGGDVEVTVTVDGSSITEVEIKGDGETPDFGGKAIEEMPEQIMSAQSAEVDGVAGATVTSDAVRGAVQSALNEAMGIKETAAPLTDGTYTAQAPSYAEMYGLATTGSMTLKLTVAHKKISEIEVTEYTDTDIIGGMAFPILAQKVIDSQSLNVDAVSGATVSSNGFFAALSDWIEQAGGDAAAWKAVPVETPEKTVQEKETDILVIGAGMAGLSAAIEAAEQGTKVILLEKNQVYSSSTTRSLGYVVGADTETQKAAGIEDTEEAFYKDITSLYEGEPELDVNLLKVMADNSSELNQWLADHGVEFTGVIHKSEKGQRATERIHTTAGGSSLTSALVEAAEKAGVEILMGTPAVSLIQEDDGSVSGALAVNENGDEIAIHAGATIVCAGSYTNNQELFERLNPGINNIAYACGCGDGDAYNWFEAAGAQMINIPYTQFMYYSYAPSFVQFPEVIPNSPDNPVYDILLVTGGAERVTAEDNFCFEFTKENWNRGYNEGYAVVDQEFADQYPILMDNVLNNQVPGSGLPFAYKEETIEKLAEDAGLDPQVLKATVERYNELCDKGADEDFGKDSRYMNKLEAPYYIIRLPQITTDGYSGAKVNEKAQVLDKEGNPIRGLYAAGSCAVSQTVSVNYFGCGTSLLTCGVFGREAAKDAVNQIKQ